MVETPTTTRDAKTIQLTYQSPRPEACATITGVTNNVADARRLNCNPSPAVVGMDGFSSTSNRGICAAVTVARFSESSTTYVSGTHLTRFECFDRSIRRHSLDDRSANPMSATVSNIALTPLCREAPFYENDGFVALWTILRSRLIRVSNRPYFIRIGFDGMYDI